MSKRFNVKSVAILGILVAAEIIFARFSIHTWNLKIGFSFVPIVIAAVLYGPIAGGMVAAIGDVISAFLFPVGAYFPGFTLTAFGDALLQLTIPLFNRIQKNVQPASKHNQKIQIKQKTLAIKTSVFRYLLTV